MARPRRRPRPARRAASPTDPVELPRRRPLARVRAAAAATCCAGPGSGWASTTVRDLLFHLPRRYDDLREMRKLGDLVWRRGRDGRVGPGDGRRRPGRAGVPAADRSGRSRGSRTTRARSTRRGSGAGSSSGGCTLGDEVVVSGKVKHFGRRLTLDNPDSSRRRRRRASCSTPAGSCPSTALTAGLTASRLRAAIREALDRAGPAYPEYLPAPIREPRSARPDRPSASRRPTTRTTFEGRDARPRRLAFDELLALQLGHGRAAAPARSATRRREVAVDADADAARPRGARRGADRAGVGRAGRPDRRPGRRRWTRSATTSPARRRCCACSRATSARARPRSRPMPWPPRRAPGCQGALLAPTDLLARQHLETLGRPARGRRHRRDAPDRLAPRRRQGPAPARRSRRARRRSSSARTR